MKLKYLFNALFLTLVFISCSRDDNNDSGSTTKPDEINNFVWKAMNSGYYWQPNVPNLADSFDDNQTTYANFLNGKLQTSFSILCFIKEVPLIDFLGLKTIMK